MKQTVVHIMGIRFGIDPVNQVIRQERERHPNKQVYHTISNACQEERLSSTPLIDVKPANLSQLQRVHPYIICLTVGSA